MTKPEIHPAPAAARIAVFGIGGVGGYLAGMLCRAYPGVTLVARGERRRALEQNGLVLHSEYNGEITARPQRVCTAAELTEQDYIFVCVKNYSLQTACQELAHAVGPHTVLVPVMNGVDPGDRIRAALPGAAVVDSLIYIVSFANADASITQQGQFASIYIGRSGADAAQAPQVQAVSAVLCGAGLDCRIADDIEAAIWRKYILNCAFNVATAYYDAPIGPIRADAEKTAEYETLAREAFTVARAKGIQLAESDLDAIMESFHHKYKDDATSSLLRDFRAHRPSEVETFSGYIVREAARLGVDVPVSRRMYAGLAARQASGSTEAART